MQGFDGPLPEQPPWIRRRQRIPPSLLRAASILYGWGVRFRLRLYRRNILPSRRLPLKVISIGNLSAGGTGKTPHTAAVASYLRDKGLRIAVLSRGYGGKKSKEGAVLSDGRSFWGGWEDGGEEPLWLAQKLAGIPVLVGRDRFRSGLFCHRTWGMEWVVLDDGFQHLQLHRDLDILLIPGHQPWGGGRLLPWGLLREPKEEIRRADVILITHSERIEEADRMRLVEAVRNLSPYAPVYRSRHRPVSLSSYPAGERMPLAYLEGKRVLAFCGLGDPGSFAHSLKEIGAETVRMISFPDHHRYRQRDKAALEGLGRDLNVDWLVTTEKDALKLGDWSPRRPGLLVLSVEVEVLDKGFWKLLDRLIEGEA